MSADLPGAGRGLPVAAGPRERDDGVIDQSGRLARVGGIMSDAHFDVGDDVEAAGGDFRAERIAKGIELDGGGFRPDAAEPDREAVAVDMGHGPLLAQARGEPLGEALERRFGGLGIEGRQPVMVDETDRAEQHRPVRSRQILGNRRDQRFPDGQAGQAVAPGPAMLDGLDPVGQMSGAQSDHPDFVEPVIRVRRPRRRRWPAP